MNRTILLLALLIGETIEIQFSCFHFQFSSSRAQEVALKEVEVKGARVVAKADGQTLWPDAAVKEASADGYQLLQRLSLPGLTVDVVNHSVVSAANLGSVELRINGLVCSKNELIALDPRRVVRIDVIDRPGVRHDADVAVVIDFIVRRDDAGYSLGASAMQALTAAIGDAEVYGKVNRGLSELLLSYGFGYIDSKGSRNSETAEYRLADGTTKRMERRDLSNHYARQGHELQAIYSFVDSGRTTLQAKLSGELSRTPTNEQLRLVDDAETVRRNSSRTLTPAIDVYLRQAMGRSQWLTANVVGTFIGSRSEDFFDEGSAYQYSVEGRTWSLATEAIYEWQLRATTLSAGLRYQQKYMDNEYSGDASAVNLMRRSNLYAFAQASGRLGAVSYAAGVGATRIYFRQDSRHYDFFLVRPKLNVGVPLGGGWKLRYSFELNPHVSQVARTGDVSLRVNSMELNVGNPDIRPVAAMTHNLTLSLQRSRLYAQTSAFTKMNHHPNMEQWLRQDSLFVYTQRNQGHINLYAWMSYAQWQIVPGRLSATGSLNVFTCDNKGDDYSHLYTSVQFAALLQAFLGSWSLSAGIDTGARMMEGETRGLGQPRPTWNLSARYRHKSFSVGLTAYNLFLWNPLTVENEVMNDMVHKLTTVRDRTAGNRLTIDFTWRLDHGRRYKKIDRTMQNRDSETGILTN